MQFGSAAPLARLRPLAMVLVLLGLLATPVPANAAQSQEREAVATASAGWHGRAIRNPQQRPRIVRSAWPKGWSAGPVGPGTGYVRRGGSQRVREVQRRLLQLGYRPGPVDGLFGPRTRAAARWFQFKHGLAVTGRVGRSTLAVLQARSDHKPLRTAQPVYQPGGSPVPGPTTPAPPATSENGSDTLLFALLALLLALGLGVIVGLFGPDLRGKRREEEPPAAPALNPPAPATAAAAAAVAAPRPKTPTVGNGPPVLGYITAEADHDEEDAVTASLVLRCAHRGWSLVEIVRDGRLPGRSPAQRPGLVYAVNQIRSGAAEGLVVARLRDFTTRIADLATLLRWLAHAGAFFGAADHELDTSTRAGRATARAVIELGAWYPAEGRFISAGEPARGDLTLRIAAMHQHGISLRAITDALNLAGIPGPPGHTRWQTTDVKAATEEGSRL